MLLLDNYRHLSLFLDVKTFLNLTTCNKKLRKLYNENVIWKSFISRDFSKYLYHPSYNMERYIQCFNRSNINYLENNPSDRKAYGYLLSTYLIYVDNEILNKILPLKEWGLIYNGRHVIGHSTLLIISMFIQTFSDTKNFDLFKFIIEYVEDINDDEKTKYVKKSADLFETFISKLHNFQLSPEGIINIKNNSNYQEIKNAWLEVGFN